MTEIAYEPLSDDAKAALSEARFTTLNVAHTWALIVDTRREIFDRIGIGASSYQRAAGITEYEAMTANPEIMELVGGRVA